MGDGSQDCRLASSRVVNTDIILLKVNNLLASRY